MMAGASRDSLTVSLGQGRFGVRGGALVLPAGHRFHLVGGRANFFASA
jgi:hypothetical protein